jgi:hypothetical protein
MYVFFLEDPIKVGKGLIMTTFVWDVCYLEE